MARRLPRTAQTAQDDSALAKWLKDLEPHEDIHRKAPDHVRRRYILRCLSSGADPLSGLIYIGSQGEGKGRRWYVESSIDGMRALAQDSGQYAGQAGPFWCGSDGVWKEIWPTEQEPVAAKVVVRKLIDGQVVETSGVAHFDEYRADSEMWLKMPRTMVAKCAEAIALRKAFPKQLGKVYTSEEMAQAGGRRDVLAGEEGAEPDRGSEAQKTRGRELVRDMLACRDQAEVNGVLNHALSALRDDEITSFQLGEVRTASNAIRSKLKHAAAEAAATVGDLGPGAAAACAGRSDDENPRSMSRAE